MDSTHKDRLLILGYDGTSPDLLARWVAEGHLPTIKHLIDNGAYGELRSVPNTVSPCAWSSFNTGKNAGKHGIYRFTERDFSSYRYKFVNGAYRKSETFWKMLCGMDSERTGCVMNIPMTYPAEEMNGCWISGFDAPGSESKGFSYPESLIQELNENNGSYQILRDFGSLLRKDADWAKTAEYMLDTMESRYRHADYLMDKYDWDLFAVVFMETDHAHHFFWKFLDPKHPDYREEDAARYGDTILRIYKRMDDITRRFIEKYPEATVMLASDHGGAINTRGGSLMADWLESIGLLQREDNATSGSPVKMIKRGIGGLARFGFRVANRHLSPEAKFRLIRMMPGIREKVESAVRLGNIDWSRTKTYCDGTQDDIWINLDGRDPLGVVPESEYDKLCDFICDELKDAVDVKTGIPIVDEVFRRDQVYSGDYVDRAADISIRWAIDTVVTGIKTKSSPDNLRPVEWNWPADVPNGGHRIEGVFIALGPNITKGIKLEGADITDVAPTVLHHFGEEIPEDFDGKVLEEIFTEEFLRDNPPRYGGESTPGVDRRSDIYSEEDDAVIEQRLKDLGYL